MKTNKKNALFSSKNLHKPKKSSNFAPGIKKNKEMAKTAEQKHHEKMGKEVMNLIVTRSGVTRRDIMNTAMHNFCRNNLDLLTAAERRKYASVIL